MAVRIRLARHGRNKIAYYRIVVADRESKRSGRHIEQIGTLNTRTNPPSLTLKEERVKYWVGVGALPTASVAHLIRKKMPGYLEALEEKQRAKIRARRKARKAKSPKTAKPASSAARTAAATKPAATTKKAAVPKKK